MATTSLERRVEALEDAGGGDEGCPRCVGTMVIIEDLGGGFVQASWTGQGQRGHSLTEAEYRERKAERECPRCGRTIDPDEGTQIRVGGTWGA